MKPENSYYIFNVRYLSASQKKNEASWVTIKTTTMNRRQGLPHHRLRQVKLHEVKQVEYNKLASFVHNQFRPRNYRHCLWITWPRFNRFSTFKQLNTCIQMGTPNAPWKSNSNHHQMFYFLSLERILRMLPLLLLHVRTLLISWNLTWNTDSDSVFCLFKQTNRSSYKLGLQSRSSCIDLLKSDIFKKWPK